MSKEDLEKLLDMEYPESFKRRMGIPKGQSHTRRMNGEREYRLKDWFEFFDRARFKKTKHFNIARTTSHSSIIHMIKRILSKIPVKMQVFLTSIIPLKATNNISTNNRVYSDLVNFYQKEISLLIAYK